MEHKLHVTSELASMIIADPCFELLATPEAVFEEARAYLLVRALSLPALLVHTVASAVCIALGDPRTPLVTSVAAAALNLALDGGLVLWPLRLGAVGAAWATLAATVFGAVLLVRRATTVVGAKWPPARPAWVQARPFLAANGVLQVRNAALMASVSLMTAAAATLGTAVLAMHQLLYSILSVAQFLPEPVSQSVQAHLTGLSTDEGEVSMEEAAEIRAGARLHLRGGAPLLEHVRRRAVVGTSRERRTLRHERGLWREERLEEAATRVTRNFAVPCNG